MPKIKRFLAHNELVRRGLEHHKYIYDVKAIKNYDGDTITFDFDFGMTIRQIHQVRLARIDTPEKRTPTLEEGKMVQKLVEQMVLGRPCTVVTFKDTTGKYGRYIAEVFFEDGVNLNDWLLENGYAVPYED